MSSLSNRSVRSSRRHAQSEVAQNIEDVGMNQANDSGIEEEDEQSVGDVDPNAGLEESDDDNGSAAPAAQPNGSVPNNNYSSTNAHNSNNLNFNNGLFGNPSTPSTLSNVPKLDGTDAATFSDWRVKLKGYCLMQGISEIVYKPYDEALELAVVMDNLNRPRQLITQLVKSLHAKVFGAIMLAVEKVTGCALFNEIEAEQSVVGPDIFIDTNANYLWNKLCELYDKKTIYSSLHVWKKLLTLTYKDGENPPNYEETL
jgi:hypothetical protein